MSNISYDCANGLHVTSDASGHCMMCGEKPKTDASSEPVTRAEFEALLHVVRHAVNILDDVVTELHTAHGGAHYVTPPQVQEVRDLCGQAFKIKTTEENGRTE